MPLLHVRPKFLWLSFGQRKGGCFHGGNFWVTIKADKSLGSTLSVLDLKLGIIIESAGPTVELLLGDGSGPGIEENVTETPAGCWAAISR